MSGQRIERERILLAKIAERDRRILRMESIVGRLILDLPNEDLVKINKMILRSLENAQERMLRSLENEVPEA